MRKRRIYVAGHGGMVGSAFMRYLKNDDRCELITASRQDVNLLEQSEVRSFFSQQRIDEVIVCAARVGGILANSSYPAEFIYENLAIECNVIHEAFSSGVTKLLFMGSSCIYPRNCTQPIAEAELLSGPLELTNEPYAIAKIAGLKLCEYYSKQYKVDFKAVMPTNLYGPNDNYDLHSSHVLPALLRKFHEAKIHSRSSVEIWGSGAPLRELLHVDDLVAAAMAFHNLTCIGKDDDQSACPSLINIGSGQEVSVKELAKLVSEIVGFHGALVFDQSKPDGTPRKVLDCTVLRRWVPSAVFRSLPSGVAEVYLDYVSNLGPAD